MQPCDQPMSNSRFQILSLDGGGIKGLFAAAALAALEDDLQVEITNHFDLIVGTSTGGIIALALGLGMRPREIVQFYTQHGQGIFRNRLNLRSIFHYFTRKFSEIPLALALRDRGAFGDRLLGQSHKRLVIPAYNLGEDDVYIFKTPHHERLRRDWRVPAWKVALATSAAPTYFPAFRDIDHMRLIDGGVWANNPAMVGVIEALSVLNAPLASIHVFSVGTTDPIINRPSVLDHGGFWQWRNAAVDVIMRGQSLGVHKQTVHLLGAERVCRIDPKVPAGLFSLDRLNADELIAKAAHESRVLAPSFKARFLSHVAPPYRPLVGPKEGDTT